MSVPLEVASTGICGAQDASDQGAAQERYQIDVSCAAAADAWLIGMPNDTPIKEQDETWTVSAFFARRAQMSGHEAGRSPIQIVAAIDAFKLDALHGLKSSDPAKAAKERADVAAATQKCAALPVAESMPRQTDTP